MNVRSFSHARMRSMAHLLIGGLAWAATVCMTIYGSRTYVPQRFQLVDEKTGTSIAGAKLTVTATQGPEILPSLHLFRPKRAVGITDERGCVSLAIPQGSGIELLALAEKNGMSVYYGWDKYWAPAGSEKLRVLARNRDSTLDLSNG